MTEQTEQNASVVPNQLQQPAGPPAIEPPFQAQTLGIEFTGSGGEYFRIWIVNLLLTIVTLGIYSAWAKVRKTRYFWSNTRLGGSAFQYHGSPAAILRGRILAGALLVAYSVCGRISVEAAIVAVVLLGVLAPWFFFKAMRFKLTNSSWRGLRFGFASTLGEAYAALLPAVILWVLFTAEMATVKPQAKPSPGPILLVFAVFMAAIPALHARIKRYQHGATTFGRQRFALEPSTGAFYGIYARAFAYFVAPVFVVAMVVALTAAVTGNVMGGAGAGAGGRLPGSAIVFMVAIYGVMLAAYLISGAYFFAASQRLVWARTSGGPVRFSTRIGTTALAGVWLKNGLLTLITLGFYWPWAAVAIARYQLGCMDVIVAAPLDTLAAGGQSVETSATGDGAADFLGMDFGF